MKPQEDGNYGMDLSDEVENLRSLITLRGRQLARAREALERIGDGCELSATWLHGIAARAMKDIERMEVGGE